MVRLAAEPKRTALGFFDTLNSVLAAFSALLFIFLSKQRFDLWFSLFQDFVESVKTCLEVLDFCRFLRLRGED